MRCTLVGDTPDGRLGFGSFDDKTGAEAKFAEMTAAGEWPEGATPIIVSPGDLEDVIGG